MPQSDLVLPEGPEVAEDGPGATDRGRDYVAIPITWPMVCGWSSTASM